MSIKEITKNKYRIDIPIGYNGNKRIRHIETFRGTKKEAILRENEIKSSIKNNTYIKKNTITVLELFEEWLNSIKNDVAIKTFKTYTLYSNNIIKCLGHIKVKDINVKILEDFYNELKTNTTYADKTIKHHYTILSSCLNCAVKWGYIPNNLNKNVAPIKIRHKEIECYSPDEVHQLISVLQNECLKYQALIMLALDSGARRGEITGLTWNDIDFNKSTININKITQYVAGYGIFEKETKSNSSDRIVYITQTTINILKNYKIEQDKTRLMLGSKWENSKRVFTTDYGADMHPNTPSKIFDIIIKKYGLKRIKFHSLRHTNISLQICSGIQAQIISKRAGHSNINTTHNIYSHFFDNEFKDIANKMETFLKVN